MAIFLTTTGISHYLEKLIHKANKKLILISPFVKINVRFKQLLEDKKRMKMDINVVYGKDDLHTDEKNWFKSMPFIRTSFLKDLHAKCYLNENEAIITSMNLYEFSEVHNHEMGIHIDKEEDAEIYKAVLEEANKLIRISRDEIGILVEKTEKTKKLETEIPISSKSHNLSNGGYCIRCRADLKLNTEKPLCLKCYKAWEKYSNPDYEEKFCHSCGKEGKTTIEKPFCYNCFKKQ